MKYKNKLLSIVLIIAAGSSLSYAVGPDGSGQIQHVVVQPDAPVEMEWLSEPPKLSDEQIARREKAMEEVNLPTPPIPVSKKPVLGPNQESMGGETNDMSMVAAEGEDDPLTTKAAKKWLVSSVQSAAPSGHISHVAEPAAANVGKYIFYSANWFAARSIDQGTTWKYIDPYADFSDFCCDQDVIYDKTQGLMIWERMGVRDSNGENRFKLSISTNAGKSFYTYTLSSGGTFGFTGEWFDYPHIALTNNYLNITWNMFNKSNYYVRTVVMRIKLSELGSGKTIHIPYFARTDGTITPAQGGSTILYAGQHQTTSKLRIYKWVEYASSYTWYDRDIPAWTSTGRGAAHCACADGNDPCQRLDHRITSGYVKKHPLRRKSFNEIVGFYWTVAEGNGFNVPYVNNAWFNTRNFAYGGRALLYHTSYAYIYAAAHPDRRGNLGIVADMVNPNGYTSVVAAKDDDKDGAPPGYNLIEIQTGNSCPSDNKWGDYNRVREFMPVGDCWLGTGHVLTDGVSDPLYFVFGNRRDKRSCFDKWKNK